MPLLARCAAPLTARAPFPDPDPGAPLFPFVLRAGSYNEYFGMSTDVDAVVYLMLVNNMLHDLFPSVITIGKAPAARRRSPRVMRACACVLPWQCAAVRRVKGAARSRGAGQVVHAYAERGPLPPARILYAWLRACLA